ncbi:MAG: dockerin type I domain-containing protein [Oscillospiraceae bacterium]
MSEKQGKKTNYPLAILLNVLIILVPLAGGIWFGYDYMNGKKVEVTDQFGNTTVSIERTFNYVALVILIVGAVAYMVFHKPISNMLHQAVQDNEYDEFGVSKKKSYKNLTRKEREAMDLQKMADMERLISTSVLKKIVKKGSENPDEDLNRLIGIEPVKEKTNEMVARMKFEQASMNAQEKKDKKKGKNMGSMSGRHMVFYGSPGTGKTTVARIITGFLYKYGYIKENKYVEIDGNFLKAGAESGTKTKMICQKAEDMNRLLMTNEGFKSRIKEYLQFPDYTTPEMVEIFELMAKEQNITVTLAAIENLEIRVENERKLSTFGNGRTATSQTTTEIVLTEATAESETTTTFISTVKEETTTTESQTEETTTENTVTEQNLFILYGDVDGDEEISVTDIMILNEFLLCRKEFTDEEASVVDLNGDGEMMYLIWHL